MLRSWRLLKDVLREKPAISLIFLPFVASTDQKVSGSTPDGCASLKIVQNQTQDLCLDFNQTRPAGSLESEPQVATAGATRVSSASRDARTKTRSEGEAEEGEGVGTSNRCCD